MADLKTKFSIGDRVWVASTHTVTKQHPCPDCKGSRKWEATSPAGGKYEMPCPRCGTMYWSNDDLNLSYTQFTPYAEQMTIGSVRLDTNDAEHPISYMCRETGIGSGSIHYEENLFSTEGEALAWAKIKADLSNQETDWVVRQYNKTVCNFELSNAALKSAQDIKYGQEAKMEILFGDLRECETIEQLKEILERFSLREAA